MANENVNIYINARDNASAAFNKVSGAAQRMNNQFKGIKRGAGEVAGAVGLMVATFIGGFKIGNVIAETEFSIEGLKKKVSEFWQNATDARHRHMQAIQGGPTTVFQENAIQKASREANEKLKGTDPATVAREALAKRQEERAQRELKQKNDLIRQIEQEANAIGKTTRQLELQQLVKLGAEQQDFDFVNQMHDKIKAEEDFEKAIDAVADAMDRADRRKVISQNLSDQAGQMAERSLTRRIRDLKAQSKDTQQTPDLQATQSRFLTRGSVRSTDPVASALKKQIEQLEDQLEIMKDQAEDTAAIRRSMELQEEFDGI